MPVSVERNITVTRFGTSALISEPSSATGSDRSSSESILVGAGITGTSAAGEPAETTWSTTKPSSPVAAISAAAVPP